MSISQFVAVIIEPRLLKKTVDVIHNFYYTLNHKTIEWDIIFYCGKNSIPYWKSKIDPSIQIQYRELNIENATANQYNDLLKTRYFWQSLPYTHALIFQSDSWLNPNPLYDISKFIEKDYAYVGGNINYDWKEMNILYHLGIGYRSFGNYNGGLSLRKPDKMLQIMDEIPPLKTEPYTSEQATQENYKSLVGKCPEDVYFTIGCHLLNLPTGNDDVSDYFVCHTNYIPNSFGYHLSNPCICIVDRIRQDCPSLNCYFQYCTEETRICHFCYLQKKETIAIYHGFTEFHYECIGYLIDYCNQRELDYVIYANIHDIQSESWKRWYDETFYTNHRWRNPQDFNIDAHERVYLVTDDDWSFKDEWFQRASNKIICIDHSFANRRQNVTFRVGTRYFPNEPGKQWALQIYQGVSFFEKTYFLNQTQRNIITCVGEVQPEAGELEAIFENFKELEFIIIGRVTNRTYKNYHNVKYYEKYYDYTFYETIKKTSYILCMENLKNILDSASGAISLSYTFGCRLIIPDTWAPHYGFQTSLQHSHNKSYQLKVDKMTDEVLGEVYKEQQQIIMRRNYIFDVTHA